MSKNIEWKAYTSVIKGHKTPKKVIKEVLVISHASVSRNNAIFLTCFQVCQSIISQPREKVSTFGAIYFSFVKAPFCHFIFLDTEETEIWGYTIRTSLCMDRIPHFEHFGFHGGEESYVLTRPI